MNANLFHEYVYKKFFDLETRESDIIAKMRARTGIICLVDELRQIEIEKAYLTQLYNELKPFFEC